MRFDIINGPNLNLLGTRQPELYGQSGMDNFAGQLKEEFPEIELHFFQSNVEGELINQLHKVGFTSNGIILNAGGYTHTSVAIADAIAGISAPVVEVHITNIHAREAFRQNSLTAPFCRGVITGFGLDSYRLALRFFLEHRQ